MSKPHVLNAHRFSATLRPDCGGLVSSLHWHNAAGRSIPLLYAPDNAEAGTQAPNRFGLWPLVPFANRAFGANLLIEGKHIALPINDAATGSNIHGFGWQHAWTITELSNSHAILVHELTQGGGPYAYAAQMRVTLGIDAITVTLSIQNRAAIALPYGLGLHPWFPRCHNTRLILVGKGAVQLGDGYRPLGPANIPAALNLNGSAPLPHDQEIAQSLVDWDGEARLIVPALGLHLNISASETLRHPVLWSPANADFVCLEPQSHAIGAPSDAPAQALTPMTMLATGESLTGWMRLTPRDL
jgi:aldose 1-epimerase